MKLLGLEIRRASSYTDALVTLIQAQAEGSTAALPSDTSALEMASGLLQRAFQSAQVTGATDTVKGVLTPDVLGLIGRELIRNGEAVFFITADTGGLNIYPVQDWDITGSFDPQTWKYRVSLAGPSETHTYESRSAETVLHFRYAFDGSTPWKGIGPVGSAITGGKMAASVSGALADEASGPRGSFIPIPRTDGASGVVEALKQDIKKLGGDAAIVESMANNWQGGGGNAPQDWQQRRLGANPPEGLVKLARLATMELLGACGISPNLFSESSSSDAREAWRQALFGLITPVARVVELELRRKLDAPNLSLSFEALMASDLQARARSFKSLVDGGMAVEQAATLSGLLLEE